ncbi:Serine/threonine-protein phosphatase PP1 [Tritrichomonas foetus]|uniref:Serine/threonine-protein phosphatase n=1 Tax=Tritrichomonas foetus TaxID=1144522 RepID=A0A1J4J3D7_9EUKA|nr:Serine/threonine-protein phosphatase PP1 [Tritrichomonas foetus]|eukprot:OHS93968.1 Serine/threonine-protein phosphatase PP1 [Tritrichomonas foetus]
MSSFYNIQKVIQFFKLRMIEDIKETLLEIKGQPSGIHADLSDCEVYRVCQEVRQKILDEKNVLRINGPCYIIGDIHGQYQDLLMLFDQVGFFKDNKAQDSVDQIIIEKSNDMIIQKVGFETQDDHQLSDQIDLSDDPNKTCSENISENEQQTDVKMLFLGDYVDRGENSIEVITFLFVMKILFPDRIYLLRGNHETSDMNLENGLYDEIMDVFEDKGVWRSLNDVFNCLPFAAILNDKIFCVHGGISPKIKKISEIENLERPLIHVDESGICDLLWSDPRRDVKKFKKSERGLGFYFGKKPLKRFLKKNKLEMMIRGHEAVDDGFELPFGNHIKIVTVHSSTRIEEDGEETKAAFLKIDNKLDYTVINLDRFRDHEALSEPAAMIDEVNQGMNLELKATT